METGEILLGFVAIAGGLAFSAFLFYSFFGLIRYWIDSRSRNKLPMMDVVSKEEFLQYKTRVEKRLQALEAVVSEEDLAKAKKSLSSNVDDVYLPQSDKPATEPSQSSGLRNHLRS
ncbi:MAG: hypothetical protein JJU41_07595 [Bacteroidetes bacterium]|nr:hypothetical protein [Bacteroidota bacterium]MCH8523174.1 hypothetical protein [Balneolales bacterium]